MKPASDIRQRLTLCIFIYALLFSIGVAIHGYFVNEQAEQTVWKSLLENEFEYLEKRHAQAPDYQWVDTEALQLYGAFNGVSIPTEFNGFSAGVHDEVEKSGRQFVLLVKGADANRVVLALDISEMESNERTLIWTIVLSSIMLLLLLTTITYVGVGKLVQPLVCIAREITSLHPDRRGQIITVSASAPREAIIIAEALNDHLKRSDEFMDRERAFINMTSHELRTPVAVIASTAEVALDTKNSAPSSINAHLQRILQTAEDMKELLTLLLALAKDPARLRNSNEAVDINQLIPLIVQDHLFLAERKSLTFRLDCLVPILVRAPAQIVKAAIGNLVRNAIENSDSGVIEIVTSADTKITITDPGRGMSEEELSRLYSQLARSGRTAGSGIGLDLIQRICKHFDWIIEFVSQPNRGTSATLDFRQK